MSRGVLVDVVGSHETRKTVAVKEIPKTGSAGEQKVMHEVMLLSKMLGVHANIICVHTVKSTGSTFYVVTELCLFSLDKQPDAFRQFLHHAAQESPVGALVLNALVQDMVHAVAFLHSKHVFHCDLKPANVLVSFDRSGRAHSLKAKHFGKAQVKLADFGVSRVVRPSTDAASETTTATVSVSAVEASSAGIAGTEAFMCPEVLRLLRDIKAGGLTQDPDIGAELLAANDAFGCGCVLAYLCSDGKHPFQPAGIWKNVAENILAARRVPMKNLNIKDAHHVELVDRFTANVTTDRWTVTHACAHSPIFASSASFFQTSAAEILLDTITLHRKPEGSCLQQLLAPDLVRACPSLPIIVGDVESTVQRLKTEARVPAFLDDESCVRCMPLSFVRACCESEIAAVSRTRTMETALRRLRAIVA